jgi:hypothetical protein
MSAVVFLSAYPQRPAGKDSASNARLSFERVGLINGPALPANAVISAGADRSALSLGLLRATRTRHSRKLS